MKKSIIVVPNAILRAKCTLLDIKKDRKFIEKHLKDLEDTLQKKDNPKGVGLAAPQINKSLRMFSTYLQPSLNMANSGRHQPEEDETELPVLKTYINPEITGVSNEMTFGPDQNDPVLEGCLSIPKLYGPVPRHTWITISYFSSNLEPVEEKLFGFYARVVQHEYDHLEGILFTDYILEHKLPLYEHRNGKMVEVDSEIARAF